MITTNTNTTVFSVAKRMEYSKNTVVTQNIIKNKSGNITLFAFDKDQKLSEHSAPFDVVLQVLDGTAEIKISDKPYKVQAGEIIILPARIPHAVYAVTKFKMLLTIIKE